MDQKVLTCLFNLVLLTICGYPNVTFGQQEKHQILWNAGEGTYTVYRIPSLIVSSKGTLLAFAEGRNSGKDNGDIDVILKRSEDNGKTWGKEILVWSDRQNTCGNPCPVVDEMTGRIWLWMTWNYGKDSEEEIIHKLAKYSRKPYLCYSDNEGESWSKPIDMSKSCKNPQWGWYATGPGFGIQLKIGKNKGRLVIPANHSYRDSSCSTCDSFKYSAHVLISDDHGRSWRMSEAIQPDCNESQVTELTDGTLLMNMRSHAGKHCRVISESNDGGETWGSVEYDYQLVESKCQASILNYGEYHGKSYYLFSNPAVPEGRTHMTIKISYDNCREWSSCKLIYVGPSAYSCLTRLANGNIGIFYEAGVKNAYESLIFSSLSPRSILNSNESFYKN